MSPHNQSLRVLHVVPSLAARDGGPSLATTGMCRAVRAKGTTTLIATTDADGSGRLPVLHGVIHVRGGVPVLFFPRQAGRSFKWSAPLTAWLRAHAGAFDLAHVHAVFSHSSLAAGRACRAAGVPYLVRPLGTLDPWSLARHPRRKRLLLALGARRLLTGAAAIHYTTIEERRLAERVLPWLPAGVVAPLGLDDDAFHVGDGPAPGDPVLVTLARLDPKKGIDLLIETFHAVTESGALARWRLLIAGDGSPSYVRTLKQLANAGPARDRIEWCGWVDGAARPAFLRAARLFALPSHQENFGIAVVEAMAAGVPVVVTPGVNLAEEIAAADAGWVAERHPAALATTLGAAMLDGSELARRAGRARQFAERYRWSRVAETLQTIYRDLAPERRVTAGHLLTPAGPV